MSIVFPRVGIRLPGFLLTANAWVLASSPLGLLFKIGGGVTPSSGLVDAVAWMSGLQVAGGTSGGLGDRPSALGLSAECQRRQPEPGRAGSLARAGAGAQAPGR